MRRVTLFHDFTDLFNVQFKRSSWLLLFSLSESYAVKPLENSAMRWWEKGSKKENGILVLVWKPLGPIVYRGLWELQSSPERTLSLCFPSGNRGRGLDGTESGDREHLTGLLTPQSSGHAQSLDKWSRDPSCWGERYPGTYKLRQRWKTRGAIPIFDLRTASPQRTADGQGNIFELRTADGHQAMI